MSNHQLKIGLVGCGRVSKSHFEAFKVLQDKLHLKAICDPSKDKVQAIKEKFPDAEGYTDFDEMLNKEKLDILTIATPNGMHAEQVIKAAPFVKSIITEKPMAISWQDGLNMMKECEKHKTQLFVIYQNRFNQTVQAVEKAIQQGRFGRIYMMLSNVFWQRSQDYYDKDATWHGTLGIDGGAYMTQASHYVDLMQWFMRAKPKTIYANLATLMRKIETEDCGVVNINWDNGALGNINITVLAYPKNLEGSLMILGEKGSVKIGGVALNTIEMWEFADKRAEDEEILKLSYNVDSVYGSGHVKNYENIITAITGQGKALIDGNEGLKSLRILTAIYESNNSKSVIEIE